ncbi:MAG: ABC transporter permease subunit [Candidatus Dormibacteraeota bacterium]|nr:ABC transporter permease subunit [Candidatus Dormibacteraeota bacterium]
MPPILTFARLTIWEAARRRLLLALVLLTLAIIVATSFGFSRLWSVTGSGGGPPSAVEVHLIASQLLILVAFMFAAVLALSSVMVAAPSISTEIESGLLLSMLARPVRRFDVAAGKWLGLAVLVVCYAAGAGVLELVGVWLTTGYMPPDPVMLIVYIASEGLVMLTLGLLFSTRMAAMTAGIVALVLYLVAWIGGIVGGLGQALNNDALIYTGLGSKLLVPTDVLWRGAVYAMEPASVVASVRAVGPVGASSPFSAADPPPIGLLVWAVIWVLAILALTWLSFRRREV